MVVDGLRDRGEVILALGIRQSWRDPPAVKEVTHDPVGDGPLVAAGEMVRTDADAIRGIESARGTEAHRRLRGNRGETTNR